MVYIKGRAKLKAGSGLILSLSGLLFAALAPLACGETAEEVAPPPARTAPAAFMSTDFTEPAICGGCHNELYGQWQGSMHNNSFTDPFYQAVHRQASADTGGSIDAFCTMCHTPIGTLSGEVPPLEGPQISDISQKGVQCDFCHTVTGTTGLGNLMAQFAPSNVKRGPFTDAVSPFHESAYSELHTTSAFCGMCHNVNHPENNLPLEATYTEWKNGPYAAEGIQCQDCHMTPGPGVTAPNPGKDALGGPDRPHIYTHIFVGGNATGLASPEHQKLARDQLQAAASIAISAAPAAPPGNVLNLQVIVTNKGAGHYIPTGLTEVREMWLEVAVTDANGNTVFHSGAMGEAGRVDSEAVMYHTIFEDREGKPTHKPWLAEKLLSDRRIPPRGTDTAEYSFTAENAASPLHVQATLHYRTAPQAYVDEVMGSAAIEIPVIDMASASADITLP